MDGNAKRLAVVIGNSEYQNLKSLMNPINDANAITDTLRSLEYEVSAGLNLRRKEILKYFMNFLASWKCEISEIVVYYSGHGTSIDGKVYIGPIDAYDDSIDLIRESFLSVEIIIRLLLDHRKDAKFPIIVILDCYRSISTITADVMRGSDQKDPLQSFREILNIAILYSVADGQTAVDGSDGRSHSPYTQVLLENIVKGLTIYEIKNVILATFNRTKIFGRNLVQWMYHSLYEPYMFNHPKLSIREKVLEAEHSETAEMAKAAESGTINKISNKPVIKSSNINWDKLKTDISGFDVDIYPFEECILEEFLGKGTSMDVYQGQCNIYKRVAFKFHRDFLKKNLSQRRVNEISEEFRHEIKLMNRLRSHTNIVQIHGVTFKDREPILIVELGDYTLNEYLIKKYESGEPANWVEKIRLCHDVLEGIQGMHNVGIIHGDLKGDNIIVFIDSTGGTTAKISDFGFSSTLSSKGFVGGTPRYKAPEDLGIFPELASWQKSPMKDIFGFGLLTYQISANGEIPYKTFDDVEEARTEDHDHDMEILLSDLPHDTPEVFRTIIITTTKFMPKDRASIEIVEQKITDFLNDQT